MKRGYIIIISVLLTGLLAFFIGRSYLNTKENLFSWEFYTLDGKPVHVADYKGKNVVLNLWASWCKPCLKELPLLDEVRKIAGPDFVFLAVSDDNPDKIRIYKETSDYGFEYLSTLKFSLKGVVYLPQTYVLDKEGRLRKHHTGVLKFRPRQLVDSLRYWTTP